jgi:hypothetical protein
MELRDLLTGGDRRSIARADEALAMAREEPALIAELARLAYDEDWLVGQRACDTLEKLLRENHPAVAPYKEVFLHLVQSPYWETRLQCVRALPLFEWAGKDRDRVVEALREHIDDEQKFVRCWSLTGFAMMASAEDRPYLDNRIAEFIGSGVPSMIARAKAIVKLLEVSA